jgi:hypothetical protein
MIPDQTAQSPAAGGRRLATLLTFVLAAAALKVSAVSLENTISPNAIVIHHSGVSESTRDEGNRGRLSSIGCSHSRGYLLAEQDTPPPREIVRD